MNPLPEDLTGDLLSGSATVAKGKKSYEYDP
jgi:hypothetical protein